MSKRDKEMATLIKEYCDTYAEVNGGKWYDVECRYFTPNGIKNAIRTLREERDYKDAKAMLRARYDRSIACFLLDSVLT